MMLPGLFINRILAVLGRNVLLWSLLLIGLGLLDVYLNSSLAFIILGCAAAGFGYGVAQPYIYDKVSTLATGSKVTYALALVMVMNYVAIVISPFIVEWGQELAGVKGEGFPFLMNAIIAASALAIIWIRRAVVSRDKYMM